MAGYLTIVPRERVALVFRLRLILQFLPLMPFAYFAKFFVLLALIPAHLALVFACHETPVLIAIVLATWLLNGIFNLAALFIESLEHVLLQVSNRLRTKGNGEVVVVGHARQVMVTKVETVTLLLQVGGGDNIIFHKGWLPLGEVLALNSGKVVVPYCLRGSESRDFGGGGFAGSLGLLKCLDTAYTRKILPWWIDIECY